VSARVVVCNVKQSMDPDGRWVSQSVGHWVSQFVGNWLVIHGRTEDEARRALEGHLRMVRKWPERDEGPSDLRFEYVSEPLFDFIRERVDEGHRAEDVLGIAESFREEAFFTETELVEALKSCTAWGHRPGRFVLKGRTG
jgi:hypothetical protein